MEKLFKYGCLSLLGRELFQPTYVWLVEKMISKAILEGLRVILVWVTAMKRPIWKGNVSPQLKGRKYTNHSCLQATFPLLTGMIFQVSCDWCVCFARKPSEPLAMFSKAPVHLVVLGGLPASAWCPQSVWTERASASGFPTPSRIPREATVGIGFHIYPQEWSHWLLHSKLHTQGAM